MKSFILSCLLIFISTITLPAQLGIPATTIAGGNGTGMPNQLRNPQGIFIDTNGDVYIADKDNHRVQKWAVGATQGVTVAGNGILGSGANQLSYPSDVFVNSSGDVFVADANNHRVQKWSVGATQGVTVAGGNGYGNANNQFNYINSLQVMPNGDIYVSDQGNNKIQKWSAGASIGITVAGTGSAGSGANQLDSPRGISVQPNGDLYIVDGNNHRVQKWTNGAITGVTVAGGNGQGSANNQLPYPSDIAVDGNGNIFVSIGGKIMKWSTGAISGTVFCLISSPTGLFVDNTNNLYVAESNDRVTKWLSSGTLSGIVAGGNGIVSGLNQLYSPQGIFVDADGNTYIADAENSRVQKWAAGANSGITVAGNGIKGSGSSQLDYPTDVFVDNAGNVFVADINNSRIQKWTPGATSGITVAGGNGQGSGSNQLALPFSLFVTNSGDIYICDWLNNRIQKWTPGASTGITVAGGNGQGAAANQLYRPRSVFLNAVGDIFIADNYNSRIQKWAVGASTGTTVAGGNGTGNNANQLSDPIGIHLDSNDNLYVVNQSAANIIKWDAGAMQGIIIAGGYGNANNQLVYPKDIFLDNAGSFYVSDNGNNRVQKFSAATSIAVTTPTNICSGIVSFTPNGFLNAGNTFQVLLSDALGNFPVTPTVIGTGTSNSIGINFPNNYPTGSNYKVKVVSTNPVLSSPESGAFSYLGSITVAVSSQTVCTGGNSVALSVTDIAGATYQWRIGSTNIAGATSKTYSASTVGTYSVAVTLNGCVRTSGSYGVGVSTVSGANSLDNYTYFNGGTTANQIQYFQPFNTCSNSMLLTSSHLSSGTTYQWQKDGIDISGATASTYNASQSGYYTLKITQGTCTGITQPTSVRIGTVNIPSIYGGNVNVCTGSTHNLSGGNLSGNVCCGSDLVFQWQKDGIDILGATNPYTYTTNASGTYSLKVIQGACNAVSLPAKVTFGNNPLISPNINNPISENPCSLSSSSMSVNNSFSLSGLTYQWVKDGTDIIGATSNTYTPTQTGNYQVRIIQGICSALSNVSQQIVGELGSVNIFGNYRICNTAQASLYCYPTCSNFAYQWKRNGAIISGANTSSYNTSVPGVYTAEITKGSKTVSSSSVSIYEDCSSQTSVVTLPTPSAYYSGSNFVCPGSGSRLLYTDDYSYSYPNIYYQWYRNDVLISGQNRRFLSTDQPGIYKVQLIQGALQSTISTQSATLISSGTNYDSFSASGLNGCSEVILTTQLPTNSGINSYSYQWKSGGIPIVGANNYSYLATSSGSYSVDIQLGTCTIQTNPQTVTIGTLNTNIVSSPSSNSVCPNGYVALNVPNQLNATYQWFKDNVAIPSVNLSNINVYNIGNYSITVSQGACSNTSAVKTITNGTSDLYNAIGFNGGYNSTTNFTLNSCTGANNIFYVNPYSNYVTRWIYQWKNGGTPIVGANSSTYQPTGSGVYSADVSTTGGCLITSPQLTYNESTTPTSTYINVNQISGPYLCSGNIAYLSAGYTNFNTYQWYKDDVAIAGATSPTYVASQSGGYRALMSQGSCTVYTPYQVISTNATTIEPRITSVSTYSDANCTFTNGFLSTNSIQSATYQWQKDGVNILGANNYYFYPTTNGTYRINVSQGNCTGTSNPVEIQGGGMIGVNPNGATICGENAGLSALTSGSGTATYQWKLNGANIGSNSSSLSVNSVGSYTLTVTRSTGCTVTSQPFVVTSIMPMETIKTGVWNNPSVWTCGRVPSTLDNVKVNNLHTVSLPASSTYFIKSINNVGNVLFNSQSNLRIGF
jgi:sugar lactone lactonase YvrE